MKKIIGLIIVILVIIAIIFGISKMKGENEEIHQLADIYNKLNTNQTYLFEMKRNDDNKVIMAKKDDQTIIDQYTENSRTTTIVKNNDTYLVLHDREEYYVYRQNNIEQNILTDNIKLVADKTYVTGTEKIKGKTYNYEEYAGSTMFMIENLDMNEEDVKTRFFFDKSGNLVYIKTMTPDNQELLEVSLQYEVDDAIFEIPSNYAEY